MSNKKKTKRSLKTKLIIIALASVLAYVLFLGEYNFFELYQLNRQNNKLKAEIIATEREREVLYDEIQKLKNDSSYIEKIARERYLMGKKDEKIYIIKPEDTE